MEASIKRANPTAPNRRPMIPRIVAAGAAAFCISISGPARRQRCRAALRQPAQSTGSRIQSLLAPNFFDPFFRALGRS